MKLLLPTLSVTAIGLLCALVAIFLNGTPPVRALLLGVVGAWAGFVVGAVFGVIPDVVLGTGIYSGIIGHVGALSFAIGSLVLFSRVIRVLQRD